MISSKGLQLKCERVLHEILLVSALLYDSDMERKGERAKIRAM